MRYLVAGALGIVICGAAGAILLSVVGFTFAKEAISIMMAGSGLMAPMLLALLGALVGALLGLAAGVGIMVLLDSRRSGSTVPTQE